MLLFTFGKIVPNLEAILHKITNCSPPNYVCIDVGGSLEVIVMLNYDQC